ncbi:MFS transporter [Conexibacter sp. DBS9H8]|uniref:MFS transporter n=1 Tax=Conexibacter sp. DBS9H8 TaxID=2937801 RepID=UPI00200C963E|nr:MFS transporter [Conexibacter sp. DBS9H8]
MSDRLDRAPWRPIHRRIAAALGIGWALDAFEVQIIGSVIPAIAATFSLSHTEQVLVFVVWFAGLGVGAALFGYLADRVGRRRLFIATLLLYSVSALATAASPSYGVFMLFRFFTGLGVGGEYSAVCSAISEFMPARGRGRTNALVMNFWALGGIAAGLVGIVFVSAVLGTNGWRVALLFGVISALYGLYARRLVPESPRWLASQGRLEEANAVIEQVSGIARARAEYLPVELQTSLRSQLAELWHTHRGPLLFGMALDFSEASGYYGLFTFVSVFVLTRGVVNVPAGTVPYYYLVANFGALAGGMAASSALDRIGRRPTLVVGYGAASLSSLLVAAAAISGSPAWTLAAFTLAVLCATTAWVSAYPTFTELFPTHLRATGVGASVAVGRIGAIVGAVVLAQAAADFGLWSAFATLAGLWGIGALAAAIWWVRGVETRGMTLEAITERLARS